ncbi:hypothetical protein BD324DRAFT_635339 [Kockovaella imperatae]|uniref:Fatty acid hydroxylase domain-containing protein n=1 Tax=Kockovaella imperatae TaxID=4999 RepID=A0A1Y1UCQ6_9TREE|nr:hypothetical protein BD324DRAFT_635339 [Kockovaella imperatae]ORX34845.1 hypothetical protein BD324DRAFT_635339 [Kockovaella imperatae]
MFNAIALSIPLATATFALQEVVFHIVGFAFEYCDSHSLFLRSKVRTSDRRKYVELLPRVLFNQFFLLLPAMLFMERTGLAFSGPSRISPLRFLIGLVGMAIGHDVVQYLFHRHLLHRPNLKLMKWLRHSLHHSTSATKAVSACYMSPPDFLLEIICPYLIPLAVFGNHADPRFHLLIAGVGAIGGLYEHSGYDFSAPLKPSRSVSRGGTPEKGIKEHVEEDEDGLKGITAFAVDLLASFLDNRAHSEHHTRANVSFSDGFGSPGICDTLFGTRWDLTPRQSRLVEAEWRDMRKQDQQ